MLDTIFIILGLICSWETLGKWLKIKYLDLDIPHNILSLEFSLNVIKTLKVIGACFFLT